MIRGRFELRCWRTDANGMKRAMTIERFPCLESAFDALTVIERRAAPGLAIELRDRARWSPERKVLWCNQGDGRTPKSWPDVMDVDSLTDDAAIATDLTWDWKAVAGAWGRSTKRTPENKRAVWKYKRAAT